MFYIVSCKYLMPFITCPSRGGGNPALNYPIGMTQIEKAWALTVRRSSKAVYGWIPASAGTTHHW